MFMYAPDAYHLNDLKGTFVDGNKAAERLTGFQRVELIGQSFLKLKLLPQNQILKAAKLLAKNALGKSTGPDEFTLSQKDGNQVDVEITTHPVKIKKKTLVLGIARDVTARKQAEAAIRAAREFSENLIETANSIIITLDQEAKITIFNAFAEHLTGYKKEEVLGKNWYKAFIPERDQDQIPKVFKNVLDQMPVASTFENPILT